MPQMAPSLWAPMLMLILVLFIYLKSILHFSLTYSNLVQLTKELKSNKFTWLW